jgi:hypothetical protein
LKRKVDQEEEFKAEKRSRKERSRKERGMSR